MWFTLSIPGDARYLETVHDLASRLAEHVGLDAPAASGVAMTIRGVVANAMARAAGTCQGGEFRLEFATGPAGLEVSLRYTPGAGAVAPPPERLWGERGTPGAVDRVEVVSEDGASVCRLVKAIPPPR